MVEGYRRIVPKALGALIADLDDPHNCRLDIPKQSLRWHAQCRNVLRTKKVGPRRIFSGALDAVVCKAIDFDSQPDCRTIEIEDINPRRMLPTELESSRSFAQFPPQ